MAASKHRGGGKGLISRDPWARPVGPEGDRSDLTSRHSRSPRQRRGSAPAPRFERKRDNGIFQTGTQTGCRGRAPALAGCVPVPECRIAAVSLRCGQPRPTATRDQASPHGKVPARGHAEQKRSMRERTYPVVTPSKRSLHFGRAGKRIDAALILRLVDTPIILARGARWSSATRRGSEEWVA